MNDAHELSGAEGQRGPERYPYLTALAERLGRARTLQDGTIVLHFTDGHSTQLRAKRGGIVQVIDGLPAPGEALLEVFGDPETIVGILSGEKDAVREFTAGGLRVRGNLGYLSDLGMELGILHHPL